MSVLVDIVSFFITDRHNRLWRPDTHTHTHTQTHTNRHTNTATVNFRVAISAQCINASTHQRANVPSSESDQGDRSSGVAAINIDGIHLTLGT